MTINKCKKINLVLTIIFVISILIFWLKKSPEVLYAFTIGLFFLSLTINNFLNNICPSCKKFRRKHPGKFCKFCGKEFDYDMEY